MVTYSVTIHSMSVASNLSGQENVVVNVLWSYVAIDGVYKVSIPGSSKCSYTAGNAFTPYASLTENQVANWIINSWTSEQSTRYNQQLNDMLTKEKSKPYNSLQLPWINS